jgi:hypothetical protein
MRTGYLRLAMRGPGSGKNITMRNGSSAKRENGDQARASRWNQRVLDIESEVIDLDRFSAKFQHLKYGLECGTT